MAPRLDPTEQRIRVFEQRYGRQATHLAAHAAFPLTLTTDVVYCLRETYLPDCPWYAAADLLLSGLCLPVGYDLYEMEPPTRRYLLSYLRDQFGHHRVRDLERFMVAYLRHRLDQEDSDRPLVLGDQPQWTVLACLSPGDAFEEIRQNLQQLAAQAKDPKERFRLASVVENYGEFLADPEFQPLLLDMADRVAAAEPIDDAAALTDEWVKAGLQVTQVLIEVATIRVGEVDSPSQDSQLQEFRAETVTVNSRGEIIAREPVSAFWFSEVIAAPGPELIMVAIRGGELIMGSPEDEADRDWYSNVFPETDGINVEAQHRVQVPPFFIAQYPITQVQWRAVAALPMVAKQLDPDPSNFKGDNHPVENVFWYEAVEFCDRLSALTGREYRLPSEAEWEYACRAGTTTPFHFGETITTDLANYDGSYSYSSGPKGTYRETTTIVGSFAPNGFGLYDMHGNVYEWCQDHWHPGYEGAPSDGSAWVTGGDDRFRLVRGGSWYGSPVNCRSASRNRADPVNRYVNLGFRVVCAPPGLL